MRAFTKTEHELQMRQDGGAWHGCFNDLYSKGQILTDQGRLVEAIESAQRVHIDKHGHMFGVEFRCVTRSYTTTMLHCPNDVEAIL